jgi:predicted AlkP superfamily pyrophosphatase or phosphodiesterase
MRFLTACSLIYCSLAAALAAENGGARAGKAEHVVLITVDGFPAYLFNDANTPVPNLRRLAAEGAVAKGVRVSNPSVTWPNHTTLVTGVHPAKHGVLFNGVLLRGEPGQPVRVDPRRDQADLIAAPAIFDLLHAAGLRTAAINWPCTRNSRGLDDNFPDVPENLANSTPRLRAELVSTGALTNESDANFGRLTGPGRDEVWTRAALQVIQERKPHLLLLHLLNTDGTHHRYGPGSSASYSALALADTFVGRVLGALENAGIRAKTAIFVTADHGFAGATNVLQPNVLFRRAGLLQLGPTNLILRARAQVVPEGGTGMIYLTNPSTLEEDRRRVLELLANQEGVAEVVLPDRFASLGFPNPEVHRGMADLFLVAKEGYAVSGATTGDDFVVPVGRETNLGYHGYVASFSKMNALLVAAGPGIKRGARVGVVDNIDIAPTMARLLGQAFPSAEGRVLTDMLDAP